MEPQRKVNESAREENRQPVEVLEEVVRRLEKLAEKGEERARALGIREEDVPGIVKEVRRENVTAAG